MLMVQCFEMNLKVRLVQQLEKPGWRNMRDVLDLLPGPSFEDTQQVAAEARHRSQGGPKVLYICMEIYN